MFEGNHQPSYQFTVPPPSAAAAAADVSFMEDMTVVVCGTGANGHGDSKQPEPHSGDAPAVVRHGPLVGPP